MKELGKIFVLNVCIALALVVVAAAYMKNPRLERLLWPFLVSMTYSTCIGGLAWWLVPLLAPRFKHSKWTRWLQLSALLSAISMAGGSIGFALLKWQPFVELYIEYKASMLTCWVITMIIGTVSYVIEESRYRMQATTLELRTRELEKEKALKAASDAKLQSLESRVHPHFLFNTLNSILSLVRSNPTEAEATIERLAALLRFSLDRHSSLVTLEDELKITRDYLEIERVRFGDRLRFRIEVDESLISVKLPAMSLQTLVENSVKYAVGAQRSGADITVRARRNGNGLDLEVTDTGPGFAPDSLPAGHGLDTLKQRLEAQFGEQAKLWTRRLNPGMEVAFRVPC
jgi:two-component system, LytTR family, sensor histidine kinase AlgZ